MSEKTGIARCFSRFASYALRLLLPA